MCPVIAMQPRTPPQLTGHIEGQRDWHITHTRLQHPFAFCTHTATPTLRLPTCRWMGCSRLPLANAWDRVRQNTPNPAFRFIQPVENLPVPTLTPPPAHGAFAGPVTYTFPHHHCDLPPCLRYAAGRPNPTLTGLGLPLPAFACLDPFTPLCLPTTHYTFTATGSFGWVAVSLLPFVQDYTQHGTCPLPRFLDRWTPLLPHRYCHTHTHTPHTRTHTHHAHARAFTTTHTHTHGYPITPSHTCPTLYPTHHHYHATCLALYPLPYPTYTYRVRLHTPAARPLLLFTPVLLCLDYHATRTFSARTLRHHLLHADMRALRITYNAASGFATHI